ncbi:hypothetical protein NK983_33380, partial [Salmonella enterica subsp. enterica serovar Typhimurium]|nr:hypothetical protein [Salmonella enterica subsp. enterica serovar Typhimurium]
LLLEDYDHFVQNHEAFCERLDALTELRGKKLIEEWKAAVRAILSVSRASSTRASQYMEPPVRYCSVKVGQCDSTSAGVSVW